MRIDLLPKWTLTNFQPAFYDSESATVLQQMAKVYAKLQELIEDYNSFVNEINTTITDFQNGLLGDFDCFKNCIISTMNNYIETIDTKINLQDTEIANAIEYMKDNIVQTATTIINQAIENGTLQVAVSYDGEEEALNIIVTREGE